MKRIQPLLYNFYEFFDPYFEAVFQWFGMSEEKSIKWAKYSESLVALILAIVLFYIVRFVLRKVVVRVTNNTKNGWDNLLLKYKIMHKASYFAPGILLDLSISHILSPESPLMHVLNIVVKIYYAIIIAMLINTFITILFIIISRNSQDRPLPLKGVSQLLRIILFVLLGLYIFSLLFDVPAREIFTGFGAATAIVLLIFRDTILGLISGIQLAAFDMVREGDWISLPKHNADGVVKDISLTIVKVENWDKTISTIPSYALVSEAVKNWRGMENSAGRRIKRAIYIDVNSVKFCTAEMLEHFKKYDYLNCYVLQKQKELETYNKDNHVNEDVLLNGRRLTNLGVFRAYLEAYLQHRKDININMVNMVRQLPPSEKGIPIEIYAFSKQKDWIPYEKVQADLFDHILAAVPAFELRLFQVPGGIDISSVVCRNSEYRIADREA